MGVLDDAIREHLELKRRHGAPEAEVSSKEEEALGPARIVEEVVPEAQEPPEQAAEVPEPPTEQAAKVPEPPTEPPVEYVEDPVEEEPVPEARPSVARSDDEDPHPDDSAEGEEDVLEETPEFLQETPEHDRLWFEQKPPRGFDFDE